MASHRETYVLGVDLGTTALKVALFTAGGALVAAAREPQRVELVPGGGAEQDPESWWSGMVRATRRVLEQGAVPADRVAGLGVSAQWAGTVAVDPSGRPLRDAIIWMDSRGAPDVARLTGGFPTVQGYSARKALTWIRITGGGPSHSGKDPVGHLAWLRRAHPEAYRAAHLFLEPKDWLNHRLTGRFAASFDSITLHWVTDNRRLDRVDYHPRLLRLAGLDRERLPDLVPPGTLLGPLTAAAAAELGLPRDVRVVSGSGDMPAAALGSGAVRDFEAHVSLGTSSWMLCHVPFKRTDLFHNMASLPSAIPGRYLLTNTQESAGVCLTALVERILFPDGPPAGRDPYEAALGMAAQVEPGSDGLLFLPWLNGERAPVDDHLIRGGFFNLGLETTRGHLVRAVLEGVALNARWLLPHVERFVRRRLGPVHLVGGGARSDLWCRIYADVLDRPVRQMAEPDLAGARGVAFQAAVALGHLSYDEVAERTPVAGTFEPDPANRAVYDELARELVNLYRGTRKIAARLNGRRREAAPAPGAVEEAR